MTTASWRTWRLERVPFVSVRGLSALALLLVLALQIFLPALIQFLNFLLTRQTPSEFVLDLEGLAYNFAFALLFFVGIPLFYLRLVRPNEPLTTLLGLQRSRKTPLHLLAGLGIGMLTLYVLGIAFFALSQLANFQEDPSVLIHEFERLVKEHPELLLLLPLSSSLTEEILFRGFLQPRIGLVASSLLFGLVHVGYGTLLQILVPAILGFVLGGLYRKTQSLWVPIGAHMGFNLLGFLALYFVGTPTAPATFFVAIGFL